MCIPTYNQAKYLELAIRAALRQTYPVTEVWVGDDASDDETDEILKKIAKKESRLKYFSNARRLGLAKNVDAVLKRPQTTYVVRCDSDDCLHPDFALEMVRLFELYPEAGVFHCNVREIDGNGSFRKLRRSSRSLVYQESQETLREAPFRYAVSANICGFRRLCLETVGFEREWNDRAEDYYRWVEIARSGYGNVFCPRILGDYRVWIDRKGERLQRKSAELRGLIRLFEEVFPQVYRARALSLSVLSRARRRHAVQHVPYLAEVELTDSQRKEISDLLYQLSDRSWAIRAATAIGCTPLRGVLLLMKYLRVFIWGLKVRIVRVKANGLVKGASELMGDGNNNQDH